MLDQLASHGLFHLNSQAKEEIHMDDHCLHDLVVLQYLSGWPYLGCGDGIVALQTLRNLCGEVELSEVLVQRGRLVPTDVFYNVVMRCMVEEDLGCGDVFTLWLSDVGTSRMHFWLPRIVGMYASHGELEGFSKVSNPRCPPLSSIMLAHGEPADAINLYRRWREESGKPNHHIFVAVLKACASA